MSLSSDSKPSSSTSGSCNCQLATAMPRGQVQTNILAQLGCTARLCRTSCSQTESSTPVTQVS